MFNSFELIIDFQYIYICIYLKLSTIFAINKYMLQNHIVYTLTNMLLPLVINKLHAV